MDERLLPLPEIAKLMAAHPSVRWDLVKRTRSGTTWHGIAGEGFRRCGEDGYVGGLGHLDETQRQALEAHLREHIYLTVQEIVAFVKERFGVEYTVSAFSDRGPWVDPRVEIRKKPPLHRAGIPILPSLTNRLPWLGFAGPSVLLVQKS
jgi:hypothetical protein